MGSSIDVENLSLHNLRHEYGYSNEEIYEMIEQLSEEEAEAILNDWTFWARPEQLPPEGKWRFFVYLGGRGTGKNRTGAEWIIKRAREEKGPIALIGQSAADTRDVIVENGPSSIMQICPPEFMPEYEPSKRRLTFPNGVTATTFSGDEPGQLRGPQHQSILVDEIAKMAYPREVFDQLNFGLRIGDSKAVITTTPTPHELIKELYRRGRDPEDEAVILVTGSTFDNKDNLDPEYIREVKKAYEGTRYERQELWGEVIFESEDSLFSSENIEENRVKPENMETPQRIAIGVDPAISTSKTADHTGIVVGCVGEQPNKNESAHGYILEDATVKGSPAQWASRVHQLFNKYQDLYGIRPTVVLEKNQGGNMAFDTLVQNGISDFDIKTVHASQGKLTRAEPISLLYDQNKIHHVGVFSHMEDEMVGYEGKANQKSPDAMDALVWAMTELMLGKPRHVATKQFLV